MRVTGMRFGIILQVLKEALYHANNAPGLIWNWDVTVPYHDNTKICYITDIFHYYLCVIMKTQ